MSAWTRFATVLASAISLVTIALAVRPGLGQQQSSSSSIKKSDYAELKKVPSKAMARRNPMANDPDAIASGANLFDQHCAECHGGLGEGSRKGPSLRADEVQQATPGTLFWLLTNGAVRRGMPVWSKLPEPQRWQLVSYVKSLARLEKQPSQ